jgi:hypothetical protein
MTRDAVRASRRRATAADGGTSRNLAPPTARWKAGQVLRLAGLRSLGGAVIPGTSGSAASKASRVLLLVARPRPPAPRLPAGGRPPLLGPRSGAGHTGASPTLPFQRAWWGRLFTGCGMIDGIDGTVCRMARAGLRMSQGRLCGSRSRFHLVNMPRQSCHPAQAGRAATRFCLPIYRGTAGTLGFAIPPGLLALGP